MRKTTQYTNKLEELLDFDYRYCFDVDYDTVRHCEENDCKEYGICRCSTIENIKGKNANLVSIASCFHSLAGDELTEYCIDRAIFSCKLWDINKWNINVCGGYYGEEIRDIKIKKEVTKEITDIITGILSAKSNKEKLFIVLEKEYGYILPELKQINDFEVISVDVSEIRAGNENHYKKLDRETIEQYKNYKLPIGVGISENNGVSKSIRLIDGYHRFAANNKICKNVEIIVQKE